jgi:hypothetical protein
LPIMRGTDLPQKPLRCSGSKPFIPRDRNPHIWTAQNQMFVGTYPVSTWPVELFRPTATSPRGVGEASPVQLASFMEDDQSEVVHRSKCESFQDLLLLNAHLQVATLRSSRSHLRKTLYFPTDHDKALAAKHLEMVCFLSLLLI